MKRLIQTPETVYRLGACLVLILWTGQLLLQSLQYTGGALIYAIDDPYIHLAVAENILRGGYGINSTQYASPSSSILYPLLLAATSSMGLGVWGPFALNVIPAALVLWLISGRLWAVYAPLTGRKGTYLAIISIPLVILGLNLLGLPFTGMEHPLHILASVMIALGLLRLGEQGDTSAMLAAGILLAPLLRFEGLAFSGAALLVLLLMRHWSFAISVGAVLGIFLGGYVLIMLSLGLPALPSSVLTKSEVSQSAVTGDFGALLKQALSGLTEEFTHIPGVLLVIALLVIAFALIRLGAERRAAFRPFAIAALLALAAHIAVGKYGWFGRYENYANAIALVGTVVGLTLLARSSAFIARWQAAAITVFLAPMAWSHFDVWVLSPSAAQNVYGQQYQMHRFATQYFPHDLVANDIGYVSYGNNAHVLDIYGLGSETARKIRAERKITPGDIDALATQAGSDYAMIYTHWLIDGVPAQWCQIAAIHTNRVSAAHETVYFFLINMQQEPEMRAALDAFGPSLPKITTLETFDCA